MVASREQLMGMTTNERLFETGLMNTFDQAVRDRDENKIRSVLESIFVDSGSIDLIIRQSVDNE
jgi:hypothetical protein